MKGKGCGSSNNETFRRLGWRCRRGMLELDVWLSSFVEIGLHELTADEAALLDVLLEETDMNLLDWLENRRPPPVAYAGLIVKIRASV